MITALVYCSNNIIYVSIAQNMYQWTNATQAFLQQLYSKACYLCYVRWHAVMLAISGLSLMEISSPPILTLQLNSLKIQVIIRYRPSPKKATILSHRSTSAIEGTSLANTDCHSLNSSCLEFGLHVTCEQRDKVVHNPTSGLEFFYWQQHAALSSGGAQEQDTGYYG